MRRRIALLLFFIIVSIGVVVVILQNDYLFRLDLQTDRMITEAGFSAEDMDVTSGGALIVRDGAASTLMGETRAGDPWHIPNTSTRDPFKLRFPQMVFRAVTPPWSESWRDYQVTFSFSPTRHMVSDSPEVDRTDGIFIYLHYIDEDNLYVCGLTKDGRISCKRKTDIQDLGSFYGLMAEEYVFPGTYELNSNLINPFEGSLITLVATVKNLQNENVEISLKAEIRDQSGNVAFMRQIVGIDDGNLIAQGNNELILGKPSDRGRAGIRLDSIEGVVHEFSVRPLR